MRTRIPIALLTLGLILAGAIPASAEDSPGGFCFRPDPASGCEWFPITEFGVALAAHPKRGNAFGRIWNVGVMKGADDRVALGAMVTVTDDDMATVTLSPVARFRLNRILALDLAPGVVVHGHPLRDFLEQPSSDVMIHSRARGEAPGLALDASLSVGDWGVLFVRTSVQPYHEVQRSTFTRVDLPGGGTSWISSPPETVPKNGVITEHWVGVRAGSYPGLGLGTLAAVLSILVYSGIEN